MQWDLHFFFRNWIWEIGLISQMRKFWLYQTREGKRFEKCMPVSDIWYGWKSLKTSPSHSPLLKLRYKCLLQYIILKCKIVDMGFDYKPLSKGLWFWHAFSTWFLTCVFYTSYLKRARKRPPKGTISRVYNILYSDLDFGKGELHAAKAFLKKKYSSYFGVGFRPFFC